MRADRPAHHHNWQNLSPEVQAAINRELSKLKPPDELDAEHCRRLAHLLGLGGGDGG